jgi:hypothetical protein
MLFNHPVDQDKPSPPPSPSAAIPRRWFSTLGILALITASSGSMMLCPCDSVRSRDYHSIVLVALAALLAVSATVLIYRRMARDSGTTAFLKAVIAVALAAVAVYAELTVAMEVVAWLARPR